MPITVSSLLLARSTRHNCPSLKSINFDIFMSPLAVTMLYHYQHSLRTTEFSSSSHVTPYAYSKIRPVHQYAT